MITLRWKTPIGVQDCKDIIIGNGSIEGRMISDEGNFGTADLTRDNRAILFARFHYIMHCFPGVVGV